ncbi:hypothetical protein LzC2_41850 [Planctomycetes bacterium LzC2]|uniref:Uncharacterized protein n=2 Tax=Alienimonas chondri TaxID=2681879 RepID=A0ABX1VJL7_9PLAN|nr:hypothetical protein [Alienimonas chondri]
MLPPVAALADAVPPLAAVAAGVLMGWGLTRVLFGGWVGLEAALKLACRPFPEHYHLSGLFNGNLVTELISDFKLSLLFMGTMFAAVFSWLGTANLL